MVAVSATREHLGGKAAEQLGLFDVAWEDPQASLEIEIKDHAASIPEIVGDYLVCGRMQVDIHGEELTAVCDSGLWATGNVSTGCWEVHAPSTNPSWVQLDLEVLLTLILCEGWRAQGWVPIHGGAVVRDDRCAILCAASGGGKTSLTAAMIRAGWRTLGDDKLLLRTGDDGRPDLRALVHTFNLHPTTRRWFPEIGDLERLPVYSLWTEKRKVRPQVIWPGATQMRATPTHVAAIRRERRGVGLVTMPMGAPDVLSTLLHQVVVPRGAEAARQILTEVTRTARSLRGVHLGIGDDAYAEAGALEPLETALS